MSRGWKIVVWIGGAAWAVLAVAATIPAHQAISNLQSWADVLGLVTLGQLLAAKGVDYLVQIGSVLLGSIAALMWRYAEKAVSNAKRLDMEQILRLQKKLDEIDRHKE